MLRTMAASLARACSSGGGSRGAALLLPPTSSSSGAVAAAITLRGPAVRRFGFGSHTNDNDPDVLEREKQRNLSGETAKQGACAVPGSVPGAEGWNPKLASDSEADVKADRAPSVTVEEMVELSVRQVVRATVEAEAEENTGHEGGEGKTGKE